MQTNLTTASTSHQHLEPQGDVAKTVAPAVDIVESKDNIVVVADMPGVSADGLSIEVKDGELSLRGAPHSAPFDSEPFAFARSFRIPPGIDVEGITAELKLGVLRLTLPKPEAKRPRTIQIATA